MSSGAEPGGVQVRRVILAGVVAGVVINVAGMVSAQLVGLGESFARAAVTPGIWSFAIHLALRFGVGMVGAYLYAVFSLVYGPGTRTAGRVAVAMWLIGYLPSIAVLREIGFLTGAQAPASAAWGLFEAMAAMVVVASVYRE